MNDGSGGSGSGGGSREGGAAVPRRKDVRRNQQTLLDLSLIHI